MKITVDAGHGPNTPGKRSPDGSLREYQFNSVVARYVCEELAQYDGVETLCTFEDGRDVPLKERTDKANAWGADVFVSIHANAMGDYWSDGCGIETFTYVKPDAKSVEMANCVQQRLLAETGLSNRGVKREDFHVLRETKMPAILAECGFMSNRTEAELLKSDAYRRKCATAIVDALVECYGLKRKESDDMALDKGVAETIINTWMTPSWSDATTKGDAKQADYIHWLANELRKAAGIPVE